MTDHSPERRSAALVTGGSRGIGAATVVALAERGLDVAFTYRSRHRRADLVVAEATARSGREIRAFPGDMTDGSVVERLIATLGGWRDRLDVVVLNASGGLEPAQAGDPDYPMKINMDAQLAFTCAVRSLLAEDATVVFVTSHWAHLYGSVAQMPPYEPIARSKHAGEQALRRLFTDGFGGRLLVATADMVEGTVTPLLLERMSRGLNNKRRRMAGTLPTATDMGEAIASAALDVKLPSGHTIVVGAPLSSLS